MDAATIDARPLVDAMLRDALRARASDVHLEPVAGAVEIRCRIDGVLQKIATYPREVGHAMVLRLMVLAGLLTYRTDIPQEGRVRFEHAGRTLDLRLAIMPTAHGLRAAVRMPAELLGPDSLEKLQLPSGVVDGLQRFARAESGMLLVTGPAGSGKTTTIYALLEFIAQADPGLSIISLEDPVERLLAGVTQIEVQPFGELTYERALKSILRQDPQVLMLGEIRDAATASLAIQAALSGHRLICTFHSGSPGGTIARLFEMGVEPYQITSALFGVLVQRLVRKLGPEGKYAGRVPVAELALLTPEAHAGILQRADAARLDQLFRKRSGHQTLLQVAQELVARGITNNAELMRVLGEPASQE